MKLMTKSLETRFAKLGRQRGVDDPIVVAKFFDPLGACEWYPTSYYPKYREFLGLVRGYEIEFGPFSLDELESIKLPLGLGIERDLYFEECPLSEVRARLGGRQ